MGTKPAAVAIKHPIRTGVSKSKSKPVKPETKKTTSADLDNGTIVSEKMRTSKLVKSADESLEEKRAAELRADEAVANMTEAEIAQAANDMKTETEFHGTLNMFAWKEFHDFIRFMRDELPYRYYHQISKFHGYDGILKAGKLIESNPVFNAEMINELLQDLAMFKDSLEHQYGAYSKIEALKYTTAMARKFHGILFDIVTRPEANVEPPKQPNVTEDTETSIDVAARNNMMSGANAVIDMLALSLGEKSGISPEMKQQIETAKIVAADAARKMKAVNEKVDAVNKENPIPPQMDCAAMAKYNMDAPESTTLMFTETPAGCTLSDGTPVNVEEQLRMCQEAKQQNFPMPPDLNKKPQSVKIPVHIGAGNGSAAFGQTNAPKIHELKSETDFEDIPTYVYDLMTHTSHAEYTMNVGKEFVFRNRNSENSTECVVTLLLNCDNEVMHIDYYRTPTKKYPMAVRVTGTFTVDDLTMHVNARKLYNMLVDELNHC